MTQAILIKGKDETTGWNTVTIYLLDRTVIKKGNQGPTGSTGHDFISRLFINNYIQSWEYKSLIMGDEVNKNLVRTRRKNSLSDLTTIKLIRL